MTWTTDKPKTAGWWWYRTAPGGEAVPLNLVMQGDKVTTKLGTCVACMGGQWSDVPMEEPK